MGALGEDKSEVQIVTVDEHGQSAEILKGILSHIEIQRFKKVRLLRGKFTSLGKPDQASVRWSIGNIVHAFIVASVLTGLDVVRIDVEVIKVLQGLRVAKNPFGRRSRTWRVDEGEEARRTHDSRTYGGETDPVYYQNKVRTESSLDQREWSCCGVVGNGKTRTAKTREPSARPRTRPE
jgi:hypothetical protein